MYSINEEKPAEREMVVIGLVLGAICSYKEKFSLFCLPPVFLSELTMLRTILYTFRRKDNAEEADQDLADLSWIPILHQAVTPDSHHSSVKNYVDIVIVVFIATHLVRPERPNHWPHNAIDAIVGIEEVI